MKKILVVCMAALLLLSFAACGKTSGKDGDAQTEAPSADTDLTTEAEKTGAAAIDVGSLTWVKSELDCYGYSTGGVDCYLSFSHPDNFTESVSNNDGEQYRGYNFNPANPDATANESPYGIYAYFMQGGYGAHRDSFEETAEGGLQERELGGRKVLFGKLSKDENTGAQAFVYYTSYSDDEWARIWVILTDPEEDGAFRRTFEESLSFVKE